MTSTRPIWTINVGDRVNYCWQTLTVTAVGRSYGIIWVHLADEDGLPKYQGVDISNLEWADESR